MNILFKIVFCTLLIFVIGINLSCSILPVRKIPEISQKGKFKTMKKEDFYSSATLQKEREAFIYKMRNDVLQERLSKQLTSENEEDWTGCFWAMELIQEKSDLTFSAVKAVLDTWNDRSDSIRRAALEASFSLYPGKFYNELRALLPSISNPKLFTMAAVYCMRNNSSSSEKTFLYEMMKKNFPEWKQNSQMLLLEHELSADISSEIKNRPSMKTIFSYAYKKNYPVVFSVQRHNRKYPGLTLIRNSDGRFACNPDGSLFYVPQIALAVSNMPPYINNGNTPQGVFAVCGASQSDNVFIGPSPLLLSMLPFEVSPEKYFDDSSLKDSEWTEELYTSILPVDWRGYFPIKQAFYAGRIPRSEIECHGTTIDPEFYKGHECYPLTPSLGCLCTKEIWSPETGRPVISDQIDYINAFKSNGMEHGFLVVVEIDDQQKPVGIEEIIKYIQ